MVLIHQTPSHSPGFPILRLMHALFAEMVQAGFVSKHGILPPRIVCHCRTQQRRGNKSSCSLLQKEKPETSRLPTLGSLIHVVRLRISDSSSVSCQISVSLLSAVFFITPSVLTMAWKSSYSPCQGCALWLAKDNVIQIITGLKNDELCYRNNNQLPARYVS